MRSSRPVGEAGLFTDTTARLPGRVGNNPNPIYQKEAPMQITYDREKFLSAFHMVASVAPTRSPKEVLNNVKLVVNGDVTLQASDMETWISTKVSDEAVLAVTGGSALLHTSRVGQILKECPDDHMELISEDNSLRIETSSSKFKLPTANPAEYPTQAGFPSEGYLEFSARALQHALNRTMFCTDPDSSRFALGGVCISLEKGECNIIGTDGRRLAVATIPCDESNAKNVPTLPIIPTKAVQLVARYLPTGEDAKVKVAFTDNDVAFGFGDTAIRTRLVEGRFPNWRQVIPQVADWPLTLNLVPEVVERCVRQAAIVADRESRGIDLTIEDGTLSFAAATSEAGQSNVKMPIEYSGDESVTIRVDHRFLKDCLAACGEIVSLHINSGTMPMLFQTSDYRHVIMPMARD
ncbi:MAG: DNA polymerase III subunit beta [bacterium]|nr:DNA polymerase III subunit beta [bacterium]